MLRLPTNTFLVITIIVIFAFVQLTYKTFVITFIKKYYSLIYCYNTYITICITTISVIVSVT